MFASFTQDTPWQVSLSSLAVICFDCCNAKLTRLYVHCQSVCVHFRGGNQVWINTGSSWTYIQILNFFKFSKTCWILPVFSCSRGQKYWRWNTREMNHASLLEWEEEGSTISPSLLEPSHLRDIDHRGHVKCKRRCVQTGFLENQSHSNVRNSPSECFSPAFLNYFSDYYSLWLLPMVAYEWLG